MHEGMIIGIYRCGDAMSYEECMATAAGQLIQNERRAKVAFLRLCKDGLLLPAGDNERMVMEPELKAQIDEYGYGSL